MSLFRNSRSKEWPGTYTVYFMYFFQADHCTRQPVCVPLPEEDHICCSQLSTIGYISLNRTEVSWAFVDLVLHFHWCYFYSTQIFQQCSWEFLDVFSDILRRHTSKQMFWYSSSYKISAFLLKCFLRFRYGNAFIKFLVWGKISPYGVGWWSIFCQFYFKSVLIGQ